MKGKHEHRKDSSSNELKVDASEEGDLVGMGLEDSEMDQETDVFHSMPCSTI